MQCGRAYGNPCRSALPSRDAFLSPHISVQHFSRRQIRVGARSGNANKTPKGDSLSSIDSLDALDRELLALQSDDEVQRQEEEERPPLKLDELLTEYFEDERERERKREIALNALEVSGPKFLTLLAVCLVAFTVATNLIYVFLLKYFSSG